MVPVFEGFADAELDLGDTSVFLRHGGEGPPVLLLHGHPRTGSTWHRVAPQLLAAGFSVVCPDSAATAARPSRYLRRTMHRTPSGPPQPTSSPR